MREVMKERSKFVLYGEDSCMCTVPRAHGAQLRRSQPAFIIVVVMKLVSVTLLSLLNVPAAILTASERADDGISADLDCRDSPEPSFILCCSTAQNSRRLVQTANADETANCVSARDLRELLKPCH
jgi:hypothetical protein